MLPLFEAQAAARFEFLRPYMPKKTELQVLDIGAGFGLIYNVMTRVAGLQITYDAMEVDPLAVDYLRTHIRPRVVFSRQEDVRGQYDVVLLSHIIEHMTDPVHFLKILNRHVRDQGILFIEVPNQDHKFKSLNEPHLFFFDTCSISSLVSHSGYKVLNVDICGPKINELKDDNGLFITIKTLLRRKIPLHAKKMILRMRKMMSGKRRLAGIAERTIYDYNPWGRWIRLVALKKEP
jgi:SAM-dependent methyltransferase